MATWAVSYDQTLNHDHPTDSQFPDAETEDAFWAAGVLLACRLAIELVGRYTVAVYDGRLRERLALSDSGSTRIHGGCILLPEHWLDLSDEPSQRRALTDQPHRELPVGHVLDGRDVELIARCRRCDDVLVYLPDDGEYGIVHLTWRKEPEISPHGRQRTCTPIRRDCSPTSPIATCNCSRNDKRRDRAGNHFRTGEEANPAWRRVPT